uniref:Uncharacterized protein n=1 Tax=Oryza glaberrima TaxID=4538 RepID=I1PUD0_ORYGL
MAKPSRAPDLVAASSWLRAARCSTPAATAPNSHISRRKRPTHPARLLRLTLSSVTAVVVVVGNDGAGAKTGGAAAARGEGPAVGHLLLPYQPSPMRRPSCPDSSTTSSCSAPPSSSPPRSKKLSRCHD